MGEIKVGDTVQVMGSVNSNWVGRTGKVVSITLDSAHSSGRDWIEILPTGEDRLVGFNRARLDLIEEGQKPEPGIGDTVELTYKNSIFCGETGTVSEIRPSGDVVVELKRPRGRTTQVVCGAKHAVVLQQQQQQPSGAPDPLKRAKAKAARQQDKAAEKMRLAARYLTQLADRLEAGQRVQSLRNETELLVDAQFLLGQADSLRDLDEWVGEGSE